MSQEHDEEQFDPASHVEIANIDMDELHGMSEAEMRAYFLKLARSAKPGQLSEFLYGLTGNGDETPEEMHVDYVERRMATIRGLNKVRVAFDDVLSRLEGETDGSR
ncbi:hypothetical protein [Bosea sp. RAC05]|uniref:hypothetical protein n=1 Tax=Bosea sp. RAC05 TaxID=1842539 RepID=UPI00083DF211|nr:hypothetical protein [Bosea sp. RAC05]AOG02951.1 hypothetical protein BSY19_5112 [Bosea sp. RAC05]